MSKNAKRQLKAIQEKELAEAEARLKKLGEEEAQFQAQLKELVSLATARGEGCLDDIVHDLKSQEASGIKRIRRYLGPHRGGPGRVRGHVPRPPETCQAFQGQRVQSKRHLKG